MDEPFSSSASGGSTEKPVEKLEASGSSASSEKALRTTLLAVLFQVSWPQRLTWQNIVEQLPFYGTSVRSSRPRAIHRDIETLTSLPVEELPAPDNPALVQWCEEQNHLRRLTITYERQGKTFALAEPVFTIDIRDDEARAFVALKNGFTPGTPYAEAVQLLLRRWEWLFSEQSRKLVQRKSKRVARPVLLPLSPVVDYSQHGNIILLLDQLLEEGAYASFAYVPLTQSWDDEPVWHQHTEPYELEYRDGHWYFTAYVRDSNTFLDYRVDRIQPGTLRRDGDHFFPGVRERRGVSIRYWVSPMLARHGSLSARLRDQHVTMLDNDQGAIIEGYAKSLWWARRLLLGYGEQVKALAPDELVRMMRETVQAMDRLYEEEK